MTALTAAQWWDRMDSARGPMMERLRAYAAMTIPTLLLPDGVDITQYATQPAYTSIGAEAVNNLVNKMAMTMFPPSRPSFRLAPVKSIKDELDATGVLPDVEQALAKVERDAATWFDSSNQRPKLYTVLRHILVLGQGLMEFTDDTIRVRSIAKFCVKRDITGRIIRLVVKERVKSDELLPEIQAAGVAALGEEVDFYRMVEWDHASKKYRESQWVGPHRLPEKFSSSYPEDDSPWHVPVWHLPDDSDYAVGYVEEYAGDFERAHTLAKAMSDGAVAAADTRNLVDQQGATSVTDLREGQSGDFIPGRKDDITPVSLGSPDAVRIAQAVLEPYERRIASAFLMSSKMVRQAERVTQEEIRMLAAELEAALGGTYATLAGGLQSPVARWLLKQIQLPVPRKSLVIGIVTGLDALSRAGDLEAIRSGLTVLGTVAVLPEQLQARLSWDRLVAKVSAGVGYDLASVMKSPEEFAAEQQQAAAARVAETTATAAGEAAATTVQQ